MCTNKECINCGEEETISHLFNCSHATEWNNKFRHEIQQTLEEIMTEPTLTSQIMQNPNEVMMKGLATTTRKQQTEWRAFMCGLISNEIAKRQEQFYQSTGSKKKGQTWVRHVQQMIWKQLFARWKTRCEEQHENKDDQQMTPSRKEVISRITAMYNNKTNMTEEQQKLLTMPIEERLQDRTTALISWAAAAKNAVKTIKLKCPASRHSDETNRAGNTNHAHTQQQQKNTR